MGFDFKTASKEQLKAEYARIAREIGDDQFFTRKELNHLPAILGDGEQVLAFSSGLMDGTTWLIALTDRRIIFLDKGMFFGLTQISIDLDKVNAVSGETGLIYGTIKIEDGASERAITRLAKRSVIPFTNKVRDALERRKAGHRGPNASPGADDVVSKLERLATLRDKGALTQDEFDQQKARLLADTGS